MTAITELATILSSFAVSGSAVTIMRQKARHRSRCTCTSHLGFRLRERDCPFHGGVENAIGPLPGHMVEQLKRQYMDDMFCDEDGQPIGAAGFERKLDRWIAAYADTRENEADVRMVLASAAVTGQSSAGALGSACCGTYAGALRLAAASDPNVHSDVKAEADRQFAGTPIHVFGQNEPAYKPLQVGP